MSLFVFVPEGPAQFASALGWFASKLNTKYCPKGFCEFTLQYVGATPYSGFLGPSLAVRWPCGVVRAGARHLQCHRAGGYLPGALPGSEYPDLFRLRGTLGTH